MHITHHKGNIDTANFPSNSLETIQASLDAQADAIEIDVLALKDKDYLLVHDDELHSETTGKGAVSDCTVEDAQHLYFKKSINRQKYRVPLLSQVVDQFLKHDSPTRLQIDFKNYFPLVDDEVLHRLLHIIEPIRDRVTVSSPADWQLRKLHRFADWLDVGFDIQFYFDYRGFLQKINPQHPPYREGAYGYYDDHLLSLGKTWTTSDYLRDRAETLIRQVNGISTLYINHRTLVKCLDDGFNWFEFAQHYDVKIAVWTVNTKDKKAIRNAKQLISEGATHFISDTPISLRNTL